eukprot:UN30274
MSDKDPGILAAVDDRIKRFRQEIQDKIDRLSSDGDHNNSINEHDDFIDDEKPVVHLSGTGKFNPTFVFKDSKWYVLLRSQNLRALDKYGNHNTIWYSQYTTRWNGLFDLNLQYSWEGPYKGGFEGLEDGRLFFLSKCALGFGYVLGSSKS